MKLWRSKADCQTDSPHGQSVARRARLALVFLAFVAVGTTQAGTVAYYRFDGSSLVDATGNSLHNGTGSATYSTTVPVASVPATGVANAQSLALDGSSALTFNYAFPFNGSAATLEFWVQPAVTGTASSFGDHDIFWTKTSSGDSNRFNLYLTGSGQLKLDVRDTAGTLSTLASSAVNAVPDNQWTFVSIVKNGTAWSLYLNNNTTPVNTGSYLGSLPTSAGWTIAGRSVCGCGNAVFAGSLDEIRLSDVALTPSQFLIAAAPVPEPSAALMFGAGAFMLMALRSRSRANPRPKRPDLHFNGPASGTTVSNPCPIETGIGN